VSFRDVVSLDEGGSKPKLAEQRQEARDDHRHLEQAEVLGRQQTRKRDAHGKVEHLGAGARARRPGDTVPNLRQERHELVGRTA
jgi:hypothetical protein